MSGFDVVQAENAIKKFFDEPVKSVKYLSSFKTPRGRELAFQKNRSTMVLVWAEGVDVTIQGISIQNQKNPGQPYGPSQERSNSLKANAPRLTVGKTAYFLNFQTLGSLQQFLEWYERY